MVTKQARLRREADRRGTHFLSSFSVWILGIDLGLIWANGFGSVLLEKEYSIVERRYPKEIINEKFFSVKSLSFLEAPT